MTSGGAWRPPPEVQYAMDQREMETVDRGWERMHALMSRNASDTTRDVIGIPYPYRAPCQLCHLGNHHDPHVHWTSGTRADSVAEIVAVMVLAYCSGVPR